MFRVGNRAVRVVWLLLALLMPLALVADVTAASRVREPIGGEVAESPTPTATPSNAKQTVEIATGSEAAAEFDAQAESHLVSEGGSTRPKPEPRQFDNPNGQPKPTETATPSPTPSPTPEPGSIRLDEPVLRWLPEITAASEASGAPLELIVAMMRLESNGDPRIVSPAGARGLMQIMPFHLIDQGLPESMWHDPAANVMAGGWELTYRYNRYGNWRDAVGAYFGFGCDVFGTCTNVYISVVYSWVAHYAPVLADPLNSGFAILPADWSYGPIVPFVMQAPPQPEEPPVTPTPTLSPTVTPEAGTPVATETPTVDPTAEPVPTEVPTEIATEIPTEVPTEIATEIPTEQPPTDSPPVLPTEESGG